MFKNKYFVCILALLMGLSVLAGCSGDSNPVASDPVAVEDGNGSETGDIPGEEVSAEEPPAEEPSGTESAAGAESSETENPAESEKGLDAAPSLQAAVEGNVENPLEFKLSDFSGQEITIEAEMRKCIETEPAREFTGVPLAVILNAAKPAADSAKLTVIAVDGYQKNYVLEDVLLFDESFIISEQEDGLQIIAEDSEKYDASYWVRGVVKLVVN